MPKKKNKRPGNFILVFVFVFGTTKIRLLAKPGRIKKDMDFHEPRPILRTRSPLLPNNRTTIGNIYGNQEQNDGENVIFAIQLGIRLNLNKLKPAPPYGQKDDILGQ